MPDTVQLIVDVAGLYACAPALEIMRPAGMAPCFKRPDEAVRSTLRGIAYPYSRPRTARTTGGRLL